MKMKFMMMALGLTMCFSTAAYAAGEISSEGGVGTIKTDETEQTDMLAVNPGDVINISVTGAGAEGDITVLSYKTGDNLEDVNVQYVNQYVADADGNYNISYIIRETNKGVYKLMLNNGAESVQVAYYKVGAPELVDKDNNIATTTTYYKGVHFSNGKDSSGKTYGETYSVAYRAKLQGAAQKGTIGSYGFKFVNKNDPLKFVDSSSKTNWSGSGDVIYEVTLYNIANLSDLDDISVTPYVNYIVN